jgi:hypothetical protein
MCSFLGMNKTPFWCLAMQQRRLAIISLSIIIVLGLTLSVTAFYFDFQYFETDKMVYEVGESVDMIARLIADFSPEGWCYVSFAAVTDLGPVFADEYFISASPILRMLNSSYTILPDDTSPGENGTTAHILFNVEIFDTVSQGAGDNIEISITRGHLTVVPVTPLIVQSDSNATLISQVVSIHDNSIEYANESINIQIDNPSAETILDTNITTNSDGSFSFTWNNSMGLPGIYDVIVSGSGNEDFLGFSKSLPLSVVPTASNLTVVSAPSSVQCQSPDGSHFENVNVTVRHEAADYSGISDSTILWDAGFNNGVMTNLGNGFYTTVIPFQTAPGFYTINITTSNPRYQANTQIIPINAKKNTLHFYPVQTNISAVHGNSTSIEFTVDEEFDWGQEIILQFTDNFGELFLSKEVTPNMLSSLTLTAWCNLTIGPHLVTFNPVSAYYNFSSLHEFQFNVIGDLIISAVVESAFYGENLYLNLSVYDINSNIVDPVTIMAYYNNESTPFASILQISPTQVITLPLPLQIQPGECTFSFEITAPYFLPSVLKENVTVWMNTSIIVIIEIRSWDSNQGSIYQQIEGSTHSPRFIVASNSSGSIIRPPPILLNGITSTVSLTTRETSPIICPRFNSGTNILSTVLLKSRTA